MAIGGELNLKDLVAPIVRLCLLMCGKALPFRTLLPFTSPRLSLGETSFIHASGKAQPYRTSGGGAEETSSLINDSSHQIVLLGFGD